MRNLVSSAAVAFDAARRAGCLAADDFIKGVYLQSEALCAQAKNDTLQTVIEAGNVVLTARGLDSIEYNCEFLQVTKATRSPAWLVNAICQEPGHLFPDVLSVTGDEPDADRPGLGEAGRSGWRRQQWQLFPLRRRAEP